MNKNCIIVFFLFLIINYRVGKAQCSFSYSKDICGERDASYISIQLSNGDFIIGGGGGCGSNPELSVLMRLNCKGETLWYKTYPENNAFGGVISIIEIDTSSILVCSYGVASRIMRINIESGDIITENYKFIPNNPTFDYVGANDIIVFQNYIYCTARNVLTDFNNKYFLIKIDLSTLNVIWIKTINYDQVQSNQTVVPFKTFVTNKDIGVIGYIGNDNKIFIQRFDTTGNQLQTYYPFDTIKNILQKPESIYTVTQSKYTYNLCVSFFIGQSNDIAIGVIDTLGRVIKYVLYDDIRMIVETKSGGYAVCGRNDLIRKLDSNFQTVYNIKSKWPSSWYLSIGEALDGGLYVTGMASIFATDGDIAFIKAEPHGGINSTKEAQHLQAQITTTPNPATTQVHIASPIKIEQYKLTNTNGTTMQSGVLDASNSIDVSQLPQGLYFLQLQLENGQMVTKKLVRS